MVPRRRPDRKLPNGRASWWVDFVFAHPDGRKERIRKLSPVQTKNGAAEYEKQLRMEMLAGWYARTPARKKSRAPTVAEFAPQVLDEARVHNKPSTAEDKEIILRLHLLPFLGKHRLDEIDAAILDRMTAHLIDTGLQPNTVNNCLRVLGRLLNCAKERKIIVDVPRIRKLKLPPAKFDFLSFEEAPRLLAAAESEPECFIMILTALRTGLRRGELQALVWDDVDLRAGRLIVRSALVRGRRGSPKSGRDREVSLSGDLVAALRGHRHLRGELVFCRDDGSPWKDHHLRVLLRRACKRAGLRKMGWHVLRHTFASHLIMRGRSLKEVQELLGHADIKMTLRYAHLSPNVKRDAVQVLDASYSPDAGSVVSPSAPTRRAD